IRRDHHPGQHPHRELTPAGLRRGCGRAMMRRFIECCQPVTAIAYCNRMEATMRATALATALAVMLALPLGGNALAWGPEGHSIAAEIAQQRLTPQAALKVQGLLGGRSLASIASWADDVRDQRPGTAQWHFVDIPLDVNQYDPASVCKASADG